MIQIGLLILIILLLIILVFFVDNKCSNNRTVEKMTDETLYNITMTTSDGPNYQIVPSVVQGYKNENGNMVEYKLTSQLYYTEMQDGSAAVVVDVGKVPTGGHSFTKFQCKPDGTGCISMDNFELPILPKILGVTKAPPPPPTPPPPPPPPPPTTAAPPFSPTDYKNGWYTITVLKQSKQFYITFNIATDNAPEAIFGEFGEFGDNTKSIEYATEDNWNTTFTNGDKNVIYFTSVVLNKDGPFPKKCFNPGNHGDGYWNILDTSVSFKTYIDTYGCLEFLIGTVPGNKYYKISKLTGFNPYTNKWYDVKNNEYTLTPVVTSAPTVAPNFNYQVKDLMGLYQNSEDDYKYNHTNFYYDMHTRTKVDITTINKDKPIYILHGYGDGKPYLFYYDTNDTKIKLKYYNYKLPDSYTDTKYKFNIRNVDSTAETFDIYYNNIMLHSAVSYYKM